MKNNKVKGSSSDINSSDIRPPNPSSPDISSTKNIFAQLCDKYFIRSESPQDKTQQDSFYIVVAGPTASGKSDVAIRLAKEINGYIINADSRQIYKEISIGTARDLPEKIISKKDLSKKDISQNKSQNKLQKNSESTEELPCEIHMISEVIHLLYGYVSLDDEYSLFRYKKDVEKCVEIMKSLYPKMTPILVGGTGLYIDSVVYNYDLKKISDKNEAQQNGQTRQTQQTRENLMKKSLNELQKLAGTKLDKLNESDRKNPHRIIRLIERGGEQYKKGDPLPHIYFVVNPAKELLEKRIKIRIDKMIEEGLIDEVQSLKKLPKILGYKEFEGYPETKSLDQVKSDIFLYTRQYSKRQMTWFGRKQLKVRS